MTGYREEEKRKRGAHMFHAGLALELSRIIWDDRRAEATAGRPRTRYTSPRARHETEERGRLAGAPSIESRDRWLPWRVVEPDAAYLRRRAAA
jgi:hypothetical protein